MRAVFTMIMILGLGGMIQAQVTTGTITGRVVDAITKEALVGARVWMETESGLRGAMTDTAGRYKIDALKPGIYNVKVRMVGFDTTTISEINVAPDALTFVDAYLTSNMLGEVVIKYEEPLIDGDVQKLKIDTEDIERSPYIRNPDMLLVSKSSDVRMVEGTDQLIIRGSRPGDAVYYIDGVKMTSSTSVPGAAIGSMEAYTGGIPAKYGDTTGGVVSLETKSYFDLYNAWLAGQ